MPVIYYTIDRHRAELRNKALAALDKQLENPLARPFLLQQATNLDPGKRNLLRALDEIGYQGYTDY
jgi:hypothetical protein